MNVLILNGGKGKRFFDEIGGNANKCLLDLNGETVLDRQLRLLKEIGLSNIYVAIDVEDSKLKDVLNQRDVKVICVPKLPKAEKIWTLMHCKEVLSDTMVLLGDVVFNLDTLREIMSYPVEDIIFIGRMYIDHTETKHPYPPTDRDELWLVMMNEDGAKILRSFGNPFGRYYWEKSELRELFMYFKPRKPLYTPKGHIQDIDFPEDLELAKRMLEIV